MFCCTQCFNDKELKGFIIDNSIQTGLCDFCGTGGADLLEPRELDSLFSKLLDIYEPLPEPDEGADNLNLLYIIQRDWHVFNDQLDDDKRENLFKQIISSLKINFLKIWDAPLRLKQPFKEEEEPIFQESKWEAFAREIKFENRYFLKESINLQLLEELLKWLKHTYMTGKVFYRGRISEKIEGYPADKMGKPPIQNAVSGRANPTGIPYLYVSADPLTTLYECRAGHLDYITVADFRLIEPLSVIRLRSVDDFSPFPEEVDTLKFAINRKYLKRLEEELSRPVRRFDKELDYLPSQYLCEYVKSLGYDGIEYKSSLKEDGINLAIFDDSKLQIVGLRVLEINGLEMNYEVINAEEF